jgi:hypothetical protein
MKDYREDGRKRGEQQAVTQFWVREQALHEMRQ